MIIDQIIHQKQIGISKDNILAEVLDITLELDDKGKIVSQSLGTVDIDPSVCVLNRAPDSATDTKRWMKQGISGKEKTPFKGIPIEKEKTQVKTLLKAGYSLYKAPHFNQLLLDLGVKDLDFRKGNAGKILWKIDGAEKDPDSAFKNSSGIKLPCVGKTSNGWVILGITQNVQDPRVDSEVSVKLTNSLLSPSSTSEGGVGEVGTISLSLHVGDGLGRNSYREVPKVSDVKSADMSEYARVFGIDQQIDLDLLRTQFSQYLQYPIKVWPVPDSSHLAFFCKDQGDYEYTKQVLKTLEEERRKPKEKTEDGVESKRKTIHTFPDIGDRKVTIALVCPESGMKTKTVVSEIFPSIPLYYWMRLESQITFERVNYKIIEYNRVIVNGPKGEASPAAYKMWTKVLTGFLNSSRINPISFWTELSKFHKSYPNYNLWDSGKAPKGTQVYELNKCRTWFNLCKIINRLNAIIELYIEDRLHDIKNVEFNQILSMKESTINNQEAFGLARERLGDLWDLLSELTQAKVSNAIAITEGSIPQRDKQNFAKGLVAGTCLSYAAYTLESRAKRRFDPGNGMHLSQLRGSNLTKEFTRASTLAENYNRGKYGSDKVYPLPIGSLVYFKAMEQCSLSEAFNNGLVCGFGLPKIEKNTDEEEAAASTSMDSITN